MSRLVFEEMVRAVEAAEPARLPEVIAALYKAVGAGGLDEAEAEALQGLADARTLAARAVPRPRPPELAQAASRVLTALAPPAPRPAASAPTARPRGGVGSRPRTPQALGFRRTWAARGYLPPPIAARFTQGEAAVLAVIAAEAIAHGACRLAIGQLAATAGVGASTVKRALRAGRAAGLIAVEERKVAWNRHDTNVVRVVCRDWAAWLRRRATARPHGGGGQTQRGVGTERSESQETARTAGRVDRPAGPSAPSSAARRAAGA